MKFAPFFKKENVPYVFDEDNGNFNLVITFKAKSSFFYQAWVSVAKFKKIPHYDKGLPDSFEVPEKMFGSVKRGTKGTTKKIYSEIKKDNPEFKVIFEGIDKVLISKEDKDIFLRVELSGLCGGIEDGKN